jgi:hypothetical protein
VRDWYQHSTSRISIAHRNQNLGVGAGCHARPERFGYPVLNASFVSALAYDYMTVNDIHKKLWISPLQHRI